MIPENEFFELEFVISDLQRVRDKIFIYLDEEKDKLLNTGERSISRRLLCENTQPFH